MPVTSFLTQVNEFKDRSNQVQIAVNLCRHNHIIQSAIRAMSTDLLTSEFECTGNISPQAIELYYVPFVRDAVASLVTVGYLAFVVENQFPRILDPSTYIIAPPDIMAGKAQKIEKSTQGFDLIFLDQEDCDKYRNNRPELMIQYAPLKNGSLTCPCMTVIDMHDAILEFTRLALLNDAINLRPKAWISANDSISKPAVYHYLDPSETSGDIANVRKSHQNRIGASNYISEQNMIRSQKPQPTSRSFADLCVSERVDPSLDPSLVIEVMPNMNITNMTASHTRPDLVALIELFDRRMCNALGIPTILLGIPAPGIAKLDSVYSIKLWESIIIPFRNILNIALAAVITKKIIPFHILQYKKTRDKAWLVPVTLILHTTLSKETLLEIQPFLTMKAFGKHMAQILGINPSDFISKLPDQ
jgi:hypothetical protein